MEKQYQYFLGGLVIWVFILLQYSFNIFVASNYLFSVPLALISLPLFITGIFETKKYYNKFIYSIVLFIIMIIAPILTYLIDPTDPFKIIGVFLCTYFIWLDFIRNI